MNRAHLAAATLTLAALLSACGPTGAPLGDGKRGAAQALFHAARPAADSSAGYGALGSGIDVSTQNVVSGRKGGSATVNTDVLVDQSATADQVTLHHSITYADFSDDGKTRFNGSMTVDLIVSSSANAATVKYALKGRLLLSGEVEDTLDSNVTLDVSASDFSSGSGSASVKLSGNTTTRSGRYDYANEPFTFGIADGLPAGTVEVQQ